MTNDKWQEIFHRLTTSHRRLTVDEIKEGGSYTFESCGDYIFVFDNNSGELLNTINIA